MVFRAAFGSPGLDIVAINDLTDPGTLAHLLKYDSVHGVWDRPVRARTEGGPALEVDGRSIQVLAEKDPARLPWKDLGIEVVVESTGMFEDKKSSSRHLEAGARRVVITAPAKDADVTVVMGVNEKAYDPRRHQVISNASCTTNCLAPVAKVLLETCGIRHGIMTTIHSYTNDQRLLDLPHPDLRRARAATLSMIPTSTGAARAVGLVLPELAGRLDGMAVRVPTPNVSLVDFVVEADRDTTEDEIRAAMRRAGEGPLRGILAYTEEPLVSVDFNNDPHSAIVDGKLVRVIDRRMVKVLAWYDNEWGYSCRVRDLVAYLGRSG